MSLRAAFLIATGGAALRLPIWVILVLLIGYGVCEYIDRKIADKAKNKALDHQLSGWEPYDKDPAYEEKGKWTRLRLDGSNQVIVTRVGNMLREI
jgi:hypothetical protein